MNDRSKVLSTAEECVNGDRNNQYGPPTQDFQRSADMLSAMGFSFQGAKVEPHHVAMMQICIKMSRIVWSPDKMDHWVDMAGYSACGYECTQESKATTVSYTLVDNYGNERTVNFEVEEESD